MSLFNFQILDAHLIATGNLNTRTAAFRAEPKPFAQLHGLAALRAPSLAKFVVNQHNCNDLRGQQFILDRLDVCQFLRLLLDFPQVNGLLHAQPAFRCGVE